jgi:hypothetical protein
MTDEEIIAKLLDNTWWPFDQVDPKLIEMADKQVRQKIIEQMEEGLL